MKIGLDWGGTKIEAILLDPVTNEELTRNRIDSPKDDYQDILNAVYNLILETADNNKEITVGIGMPGSLHPKTGLVQVSNTKVLEGQNVKKDLEEKLGFEIKIANDADCLALSEAIDGAGKEFNSIFAVILGTGVGAGYVVNQQLVVGPNKLTGEWGQNPIPGPMDDYEKSIKRHCGRIGAIEVFLSGPGLESWYEFKTKFKKSPDPDLSRVSFAIKGDGNRISDPVHGIARLGVRGRELNHFWKPHAPVTSEHGR